ncbi:MAG: hydantoinase/oxoprolinase family protein [Rhizobiales bacterium]|nr:hydantoinase/oxoprolinase family protein [Hyphomicrobiales bacterium]
MADNIMRVATDVGGTFTDMVCFKIDNKTGVATIHTAKSDTTPPNFEQGVLDVLKKGNIDPKDVDFMAHGTTIVINALTERKGAKVGLITTEGFRDILEIARGNRPDFFNLHYKKPAPFVERYLRKEVVGRVSYKGKITTELDLSTLPEILDGFKQEGVEAIAICFMHSYANPTHELQTLEEIHKLWPEISAVSSHQITREWREYERTNTAVLSAYVQPIAERYLSRLRGGLKDQGLKNEPYIMQSNCGIDTLSNVSKTPITMVESGPASGFWGAAELSKFIGEPNVLALDIGGTTAKCSLIENNEVKIMTDYWIERDRRSAGYPIMVPVVDLVEIGNGGGSIAWVDDFKKLHVGPKSAGALPGPAAYGKGGTEATTTDANLVLGRINRDYFCGGAINADIASTQQAIKKLADKLEVSEADAARGIIRIANNNMVNALKLISVNRGHDPRDFTLVAFGGGGAMHAVALANELGIKKVVIPAGAAVFSAWGMMMSDLRRDFFVTQLSDLNEKSIDKISGLLEQTKQEALAQFATEDIAENKVSFLQYGKFRYQNQEHTTEVLLPEGVITAKMVTDIQAKFHADYEKEYTYRLNAPIEMVGIHLVAKAAVGKLEIQKQKLGNPDASMASKGQREVDYALEGIHMSDIYDGDKLTPGMVFNGPAIIEDSGTTTVINPNCHVSVDAYSNIHIQLKG